MQRRRILLLVLCLILGFLGLSARLVWLQGFEWREQHLRAESFHRRVWSTPAPRGRLLDRTGTPIASDEPSLEIVFVLSELEPVRWICRRVYREIRSDASGRSFPYDAESLWSSLEDVRASLRPDFGGDTPSARILWLSQVPTEAAAGLAHAVHRRPENFPGIEVEAAAGEVWIDPSRLFAGEIAVRRIERRLSLPSGSLFGVVWEQYRRVQDPELDNARREELYRTIEHRLVRDAPVDLIIDIVSEPERFPGLRAREAPRRRFAGPAGIAPLVGRVGLRRARDEEEWAEAQEPIVDRIRLRTLRSFVALLERSHHSEDFVGHTGLEAEYEEWLRGRSGGSLVVVDHRQNPRGEPLDEEPPRPGADVTLTLDLELCEFLDELAHTRDAHGAAMLVADPRNGEILGWSSYPAATPDVYRDPAEYQRVAELGRGHFYDRPLNYPMDPGSTFKTLMALAALEEGVVTPGERITCSGFYDPGRPDRLRCANHTLYVDLDLEEALMRSCNVYFYRVGGDRLGLQGIEQWGFRAGFWQPVDCGAPRERVGQRPRSSPQSCAIGRTFTATPLQMLRWTCILGNRGRDPGLTLRAGVHGTTVEPIVASPENWRHVIDGMAAVVREPKGTASDPRYGLHPFDCAAKSGTAGIIPALLPESQRYGPDGEPRELNVAWIMGFAPVEDPQIAFVIGLERVTGHGGDECAPIAARILEWLEEHRGYSLRWDGER